MKSESEVAQSCPTLSDPMDCSPPGSSVHGICQARVLEWGAIAAEMLNIDRPHPALWWSLVSTAPGSSCLQSGRTGAMGEGKRNCIKSSPWWTLRAFLMRWEGGGFQRVQHPWTEPAGGTCPLGEPRPSHSLSQGLSKIICESRLPILCALTEGGWVWLS